MSALDDAFNFLTGLFDNVANNWYIWIIGGIIILAIYMIFKHDTLQPVDLLNLTANSS